MPLEGSNAAGKYRDRATLIRTTTGEADEYGNTPETVENIPLWADILELTGREKLANGAVQAMRQATMRFRASSLTMAMAEDDRIEARGVTWAIRGIARLGRKHERIEVICETGGAD